MKILSWNVNGLRAVVKYGFESIISDINPDIICLQEVRCLKEQLPASFLPEFLYKLYNPAEKLGYSGTAMFFKHHNYCHMSSPMDDFLVPREGRVIAVDIGQVYLLTVYVPNSGSELKRLPFRYSTWDPYFLAYISQLDKEKPVIVCGDFNVAHADIDLSHPERNHFSAGFTDEERAGFEKYISHNFCDIFRKKYPDARDAYTWWSYRTQARKRNIGWRIDYFLCSERIFSQVNDIQILSNIFGSDHAPIVLDIF